MKKFWPLALFVLALTTSCFYDVEEELYPEEGECVTTGVTYTGFVEALIEQRCLTCHAQSINLGGVNLEGYAALKVYVDNGEFLGSVRHDPGFSPMPENQQKMPECDILKLEAWIADGALEN